MGYKHYKCDNCTDSYKEAISKLGHTAGEWVTEKEATETETGLKCQYCVTCGTKLDEETLPIIEGIDKVYTIDLGNGQTTTVVGHFDDAYAQEAFRLLNEYRVANGLAALKTSSSLDKGAAIRAYEIAYLFEHTRPNGERCFSVSSISRGENIAAGYRTPEAVMEGWKNSSGHNENMLRSTFKSVSVQCFAERIDLGNGQYYYYYHWVQLFG